MSHYFNSNKKVYFFPYYSRHDTPTNKDEFWRGDYYYRRRGYLLLIPNSKDNITQTLKSKYTTITKKNAVLYFGKTSNFPRFKLADSSFKRCIKPEKADYIVINSCFTNELNTFGSNIEVYEDSAAIYIVDPNSLQYFSCNDKQVTAGIQNDFLKTMVSLDLFYGENPGLIHSGPLTYINGESNKNDLENILNGTYKNIISDKIIDTEVNKILDVLDKETLNTIIDMLNSSDKSNVGLGLKLLTGFNADKTPMTIKMLLMTHQNVAFYPEWNSAAVKQLRESIGFSYFDRFPRVFNALLGTNSRITDEDIDLCQDIISKEVMNHIENTLGCISDFLFRVKLKLDYHVEKL